MITDAEKADIEGAVVTLRAMVDHLWPMLAVVRGLKDAPTVASECSDILNIFDRCYDYLISGLFEDMKGEEANAAFVKQKMVEVQKSLTNVFNRLNDPVFKGETQRILDEKRKLELGPAGTGTEADMSDIVMVACKTCGSPCQPNEMMRCNTCIRTRSTFGDEIPRRLHITQCRHCQRWNRKGATWVTAAYESQELMAVLLNKVPILKDYEIIESKFLWMEPNSMRIKLQLIIRKDIMDFAIDKTLALEWVVSQTICPACEMSFTPQTWKAIVSLRQHGTSKGTLKILEETIRKHDAQNSAVSIDPHKDGFDCTFGRRQDAEKFVSFCKKFFVMRHALSEQLISHNANDNTANKKFTHSVTLAPISKGDLVYIEKGLLGRYGNCPQLMICLRITTSITLMDPFTMRAVDVSPETYWKYPCRTVATTGHLHSFLVHDVEETELDPSMRHTTNPRYFEGGRGVGKTDKGTASLSIATTRFKPESLSFSRYRPCEVELAREGLESSGFYETDRVRCHLGLHVKPGDTVEGYDLRNAVINFQEVNDEIGDEIISKMPGDIMLVRIKKRMAADNIPGPHQAQSSRMRVEQMKQQVARSRKDFGPESDDECERAGDLEMMDELNSLMEHMQI